MTTFNYDSASKRTAELNLRKAKAHKADLVNSYNHCKGSDRIKLGREIQQANSLIRECEDALLTLSNSDHQLYRQQHLSGVAKALSV